MCCFCLGLRFANNKFLFVDHEKTTEKQKEQKTLQSRRTALIPDWGTQVNRLRKDEQNHLQQGPMKNRLAD
eukprot:4180865-Prorocentrum_lima.AAC.1